MSDLYLTECDREPIHLCGRIQNRGFLIGISHVRLEVTHLSENIARFLAIKEPADFLGRNVEVLAPFIENDAFQLSTIVASYNRNHDTSELKPVRIEINKKPFYAVFAESGNSLIIEFEQVLTNDDLSEKISSSVASVLNAKSVSHVFDSGLNAIKKLIGYNRVIAYKFLEDGTGLVVGEAADGDDSWMGLHYPESDIPKQARELYKINQMRLIDDVFSPTHAVLSKNTDALDMTCMRLRAVSPVHIEYLKNMKDGASFSISIMDGDKLWGLVSCHNAEAKNIDYKVRQAAKLIANIMFSQYQSILNEDNRAIQQQFDEFSSAFWADLVHANDPDLILKNSGDRLLKSAEADGVAICLDNETVIKGITPSKKQLDELKEWFAESNMQVYYSRSFHDDLELKGKDKIVTPGVFIAKINDNGSCIMWFKNEYQHNIQWAGNPSSKKMSVKDGLTSFSPRESFSVWREEVRDKSKSWTDNEIKSLKKVVRYINENYEHKNKLITDFEKSLSEHSKNFETFLYTVSHGFKTPLSVIKVYSQMLMLSGKMTEKKHREVAGKIVHSVDVMDQMLKGIHNLMLINRAEPVEENVDVNELVKTVIAQQKTAFGYQNTEIEVGDLPHINADPSIIVTAFSNIIGNALKYSARVEKPVVALTGYNTGNHIIFRVLDNGIGISPDQVPRVFEIFKRLENAADYEGTGVGLYIAKLVMEKHKGFVWHIGSPGEATVFYLIFNKNS